MIDIYMFTEVGAKSFSVPCVCLASFCAVFRHEIPLFKTLYYIVVTQNMTFKYLCLESDVYLLDIL